MEISSEDRHHYSKSLQRIADRDFAKTEMCGVVDSVRCFAGTRASVGLRAKDKSNRRGGDATSREMARDLGEANHGVIPSASEGPRRLSRLGMTARSITSYAAVSTIYRSVNFSRNMSNARCATSCLKVSRSLGKKNFSHRAG